MFKLKYISLALVALVLLGMLAGAPLASAQAVCAETYNVASGDTLGAISLKFLGTDSQYQLIADATNAAAKADPSFATISDVNVLEVGWKLCIPAKAGGTTTAPSQTSAPNVGGAAAGWYTQTGPAADASHLVYLITLDPNGGFVTTMSYVGKSNIEANGAWKQNGDVVTLDYAQDNGQPSTAVVVFKAEGDKLTTTQDDNKQFGNVGFVATKTPANIVTLSGVWNTNLKNAEGSDALVALTTVPDGTAMFYESVSSKDGVSKSGTWTADGNKVTVNLTKKADQDIQETLVFELQGDKLVAVEIDKTVFPNGLTLAHVQTIGATAATAPAAAAPTPAPTAAPVAPLTLAQLGNATYKVQDAPNGSVTLKDGKAEIEIAPGSASKYTAQIAEPLANGTLNAKPYAAAVLITSGGGSGTFYNLAVVPNENGNPGTGLTALLGDRIKVNAIAFVNNAVQVDYLDRKPEESFADAPTVPVTKYFVIDAAGALVEGQPGTATSGTPVGGTGFVGSWLAWSPAADASGLLETLVLAQDGTASLSSNYVGKGVIVETGTWAQTSETSADVTFTKMDDKNINDAYTFSVNGDTLTATSWDRGTQGDNAPTYYRASGNITGTVSYLQKIALPNNAVVEVYLVDASQKDMPGSYMSGTSFTTNGSQVPLDFAVPYPGSKIDPNGNYILVAYISADGRLLFKNSNGVKVLTGGAPTSGVEVIVEPPAQ